MSNKSLPHEPIPEQFRAVLNDEDRKRLKDAESELARLPQLIDGLYKIADPVRKLVSSDDKHIRNALKWNEEVPDLQYELNRLDGITRRLFRLPGAGPNNFYRPAWWLLGIGQDTAALAAEEAIQTMTRLKAVLSAAARVRGILAPFEQVTDRSVEELRAMIAEPCIDEKGPAPKPQRVSKGETNCLVVDFIRKHAAEIAADPRSVTLDAAVKATGRPRSSICSPICMRTTKQVWRRSAV